MCCSLRSALPTASATVATLGLMFALTIPPATAQDIPKRKSGLWEINMDNSAARAKSGRVMTISQCVDSAKDDLSRQIGQEMAREHKCSQSNMRRTPAGISFESACEFNGTKMKSATSITGDFSSSYKMEIHTTYDPPLLGRAEGTTTMEAKYLGACKAGQRPGDMTMPGGMTMNVYDMMDGSKK